MKNEQALFTLREALDAVDERLFQAVSDRSRVVAEIAALKGSSGKAVFDRDRERIVRQRHLELGTKADLPVAVSQAISRAVLSVSHAQQAAELSKSKSPRRFLIVGGRGGMGRFFARALQGRGHTVDSLDRGEEQRLALAVKAADVVLICVPMGSAVAVASQVAPLMRPDALLGDINSLKLEICEAMGRLAECEVLGLHPMFGPTVDSLLRQKVVVCDVKPGPLGKWLREELGRLGADLVESDPLTHDRMMAVVQVLVHFNTMVTGEALRRSGASVQESLAFTSPIYRLELAFVGRMFAQDPHLYAEILMRNPVGGEMRAHFLAAAQSVDALVEAGDREGFVSLFRSAGSTFAEFGQEAMRLSDDLIARLVSQA